MYLEINGIVYKDFTEEEYIKKSQENKKGDV